MKTVPKFQLIGQGVYSFSDASRLTHVPLHSVKRWTQGYEYKYKKVRLFSPAVIVPHIRLDGLQFLTFADLVELRVLQKLRSEGVSHPTVRQASSRAKEILQTEHPFSHARFLTDGREILMDVASRFNDDLLLDLVHDQLGFESLLRPVLKDVLDYDGTPFPKRWYPHLKSKGIVIDPQRSFGQPIVTKEGIRTQVLSRAVTVEGSIPTVAWWYELPEQTVREAVDFEVDLSRRKAA